MNRTAAADFNLTALCFGLGVVIAGCLGILAFTPGWASPTLAAIASLLLLLHSREFVSSRQRVAVMVPGFLGLAAVISAMCLLIPGTWRIFIIGGLVLLAGLLLAGARGLPGRKMLPHWGRAGDWAHTTLAIAIIPMTFAALNLYALVRASWS